MTGLDASPPAAPVALHMGALHGAEGLLVLLLALGPLAVAFVTVFYLRWRGEHEG